MTTAPSTTGAATGGEGEVFRDAHVGRGAAERVLEDAADEAGALVLGPAGDVVAGDLDLAVVGEEGARDGVEKGGFARAVHAEDDHELAVGERQVDALEGADFIDGAGVEGLAEAGDLEHGAGGVEPEVENE